MTERTGSWYHGAMNNAASDNNDQVQQQTTQQDQTGPVVTPVGSVQKETGPVKAATEFVKPSESAPSVSPELAEMGVETKGEHPTLTPADLQAGITHAKEATPVLTQPTSSVQYPMNAQQAKRALHARVGDSIRWLALLILRQMKMEKAQKTK